jgi:hypothetical protein
MPTYVDAKAIGESPSYVDIGSEKGVMLRYDSKAWETLTITVMTTLVSSI